MIEQKAQSEEMEAMHGEYTVQDFVSSFEDAEHITYEARVQSEKCRDYFHDKQLTAEETAWKSKHAKTLRHFHATLLMRRRLALLLIVFALCVMTATLTSRAVQQPKILP